MARDSAAADSAHRDFLAALDAEHGPQPATLNDIATLLRAIKWELSAIGLGIWCIAFLLIFGR